MNSTQRATRIAIVGGVAGGASAATRARRCNEHAHITMFEKDAHVSFANCGLPYYIGDEITDRESLLVATPELFRDQFRIDVRTRQEVTRIVRDQKVIEVLNHQTGERYRHPYDKLILAPGASPIVPPIDNLDANAHNAFTLRNLEDTDRIRSWVDDAKPRRAIVIGAGFIGLEMVEQLVRRHVAVTLVELQTQVLPLLDPEMAAMLAGELRRHAVDLRLGDVVTAVEREGDRITAAALKHGGRIEADLLIIGIGVRPNTQLAEQASLTLGKTGGILVDRMMRTSDPDIYAVGDAAEYPYGPTGQPLRVPLAGPANRAGRIAGEHAASGGAQEMGEVWGTSIVRVFDLAAGLTGLTQKLAQRLGISARSVTVTAKHHAGYYPGAEPITLKLLYAPDTGKVLGAQAVGRAGIDKRLDIIATLMHFGGTVRDLAQLGLAYAPPFGSAKDAVHMAAFAASNELDGLVRFTPPDADLSNVQTVDVRSPQEVAARPLAAAPHAINIPIEQLRNRLHELDPHQPTVTVCASGLRSYLAARILAQHGFADVADLTGGAQVRELSRPLQPEGA